MLKELRENMDKELKETRKVKLNRNSGAEKHSDWNEKFTKGIEDQMWATEQRMGELEERASEMTGSEEQKEKWISNYHTIQQFDF